MNTEDIAAIRNVLLDAVPTMLTAIDIGHALSALDRIEAQAKGAVPCPEFLKLSDEQLDDMQASQVIRSAGDAVPCAGQDGCAREKARRVGMMLPVECTCAHPPQPSPASASQGLPEYHEQYLDAIGEDPLTAAAHAIGVKYLMVGELKVKDDSSLIYKGLVLPVLGYYMKWPSVGHHSDGWDEYRVSLVGKGFEHQETNIATGDIEWINAERLTKLAAKSQAPPAGVGEPNVEAMARRFHDAYEELAPSFGYETRKDTRTFDPTTPNGKLMIAVCERLSNSTPNT